MCKYCHKEFLNLKLHIKMSFKCQNSYITNKDRDYFSKENVEVIRKDPVIMNQQNEKSRKQNVDAVNSNQAIEPKLQNQQKQIENKEFCNGCRKEFKLLLSHLLRSQKCQSFYEMDILKQKKEETIKTKNREKKTE